VRFLSTSPSRSERGGEGLTRKNLGEPGENPEKTSLPTIHAELTTRPKMVAGTKKTENLVRFGMVGVFDGPEVIDPQGLGA